MNEVMVLTKRNIKVFLRDRVAVFFSFFSAIILLGLYLLFLKNLYEFGELSSYLSSQETDFLRNSLMIGGVLVINTLSLALGNLGNIVNDYANNLLDAFLITPVIRWKIIVSYYISSFIITYALNLLLWLLAVLIIGLQTGIYYRPMIIINVSLLLILFTFISIAVMIFIVSFIKSVNAFGAVSGVTGTLFGFISGVYMPLSLFPAFIQNISSLVPFTHMAILIKKVLLEQGFDLIIDKLGPSAQTGVDALKEAYLLNDLPVFGLTVSMPALMIMSCGLAVVFLGLSTLKLSKLVKR